MSNRYGIVDAYGRFLTPNAHRHHPLRVIGGYLHGEMSVVRDNPEYRVWLHAGEFLLVPTEWPAGTELAEIAKLRIFRSDRGASGLNAPLASPVPTFGRLPGPFLNDHQFGGNIARRPR